MIVAAFTQEGYFDFGFISSGKASLDPLPPKDGSVGKQIIMIRVHADLQPPHAWSSHEGNNVLEFVPEHNTSVDSIPGTSGKEYLVW